MIRSQLIILLVFLSSVSFAQNKKYAQKVLETLTSPEYDGRGYVNGGDAKAADYIAKEMERYGLKKFDGSYLQHFKLDVNTFPSEIVVEIDGKALTPGTDFVVSPYSGSSEGEFTPLWVNKDNYEDKDTYEDIRNNKILILDPAGIEDKEKLKEFNSLYFAFNEVLPTVLINDSKFTWGVGRQAMPNAMVEILRDKLPTDAETITLKVKNKLIKDYQSQNVVGYLPGKDKKKKKQYVVVCGHYDHLGRMGPDTYFPGANDNASGIAYLLSMMRYFAEGEGPDYTMVFIAFGGEEAGLVGSEYFCNNPLMPLKKTRFVLNLDIMGTGSEGITVVNSTVQTEEYQIMLDINNEKDLLAKIKKRGPTQNSDHYHFTTHDVPAFFIYTLGGSPAYHDVEDTFGNIQMEEYDDLMTLFKEFLMRL